MARERFETFMNGVFEAEQSKCVASPSHGRADRSERESHALSQSELRRRAFRGRATYSSSSDSCVSGGDSWGSGGGGGGGENLRVRQPAAASAAIAESFSSGESAPLKAAWPPQAPPIEEADVRMWIGEAVDKAVPAAVSEAQCEAHVAQEKRLARHVSELSSYVRRERGGATLSISLSLSRSPFS
eukprot:SAG11_NODE_282_length_11247_cov_11.050323_4_plen_186_part_00